MISLRNLNRLRSLIVCSKVHLPSVKSLIRSSSFFGNYSLKPDASLNMSSIFKEKYDIYKGVTISTEDFTLSDVEFETTLKGAIIKWMESGIRGIWFRVCIEDSAYVPILVKNKFVFHHAKESYVMLTRWLPDNEPNLLPQFPHTHIGVGGMVINEKNEVLVIQERFQQKPHWKLPGGYSNPGEEFADTAHREVLEETGIDAEFVSVVSLRHHHKHLFHCSDIYVVCHMRPKNADIICSKDEVALCQWMDIETYRTHPDVTEFNKFVIEAFLESQNLKAAIVPSPVLSFRKDSHQNVYTVKSLTEVGKIKNVEHNP